MRERGKKSNRNGSDSEYSIQVAICQLLDLKAPWLLYCASAGGARTSLIEARTSSSTSNLATATSPKTTWSLTK